MPRPVSKFIGLFGKHTQGFRTEFAKQLLNLVTSGFGLVAALAWNELIREIVNDFVKPVVGQSSGIISLLVYAVTVTILAVLVTYNLTRFTKKD
jgi:uncharacterized membrane protein (DUF106 family)